MAAELSVRIVIDCADAERLSAFWAAALGCERHGAAAQYVVLGPPAGTTAPELIFQQVPEPKAGKNRLHLDIDLPAGADLAAEVERLVGLGATVEPGGDVHEFDMHWIRMADPEGNELCVCTPETGA